VGFWFVLARKAAGRLADVSRPQQPLVGGSNQFPRVRPNRRAEIVKATRNTGRDGAPYSVRPSRSHAGRRRWLPGQWADSRPDGSWVPHLAPQSGARLGLIPVSGRSLYTSPRLRVFWYSEPSFVQPLTGRLQFRVLR